MSRFLVFLFLFFEEKKAFYFWIYDDFVFESIILKVLYGSKIVEKSNSFEDLILSVYSTIVG